MLPDLIPDIRPEISPPPEEHFDTLREELTSLAHLVSRIRLFVQYRISCFRHAVRDGLSQLNFAERSELENAIREYLRIWRTFREVTSFSRTLGTNGNEATQAFLTEIYARAE